MQLDTEFDAETTMSTEKHSPELSAAPNPLAKPAAPTPPTKPAAPTPPAEPLTELPTFETLPKPEPQQEHTKSTNNVFW
jgi:hypothetical protein